MLELNCLDVSLSGLARSREYASLILPSFLSKLLAASPTEISPGIAVEARLESRLVGLALIELLPYKYHQVAEICSFVVEPNCRNQGIGHQLFAFLQNVLIQQRGMHAICFKYVAGNPFAEALEKIIASQGWLPPKIFLIRYHFDVYAFDPPWFHHSLPLPPSMKFFPWNDLQPSEKIQIEFMESQGIFLPLVSPFLEEAFIDAETSVGLRLEGKIAGWCITHRIDPLTIRFSALYVDSSLHQAGHGIALLAESIRRLKQLNIPRAFCEINLSQVNRSWLRFVNKRLMPHADRIERVNLAMQIFA